MKHEREKVRDGAETSAVTLNTTGMEVELSLLGFEIGEVWLDPSVRVGGGAFDAQVTDTVIGAPRSDGMIGWMSIGVTIDPCYGCGWTARAEYRHRRTFGHTTLEHPFVDLADIRFGLRTDQIEGLGAYSFQGGRLRAYGGLRLIHDKRDVDDGFAREIIFLRREHQRTEPFAGVDVQLGRGVAANIEIGRADKDYQMSAAMSYRFRTKPRRPVLRTADPTPLVLDGVALKHGMLAFETKDAFERTLEQMSSDAPPEELERRLSHASLRALIARRQHQLESEGLLDPYNDPDNHFIQDEALRTLLNERNEVQIGSSILTFWDSNLTVEVPASRLDVLTRLRTGAAPYELSEAGAVLHSADSSGKREAVCKASFSIVSSGLRTFTFLNHSTGDPPLEYFWDFDDGTTSNAASITHGFTNDEPRKVCLTTYGMSGCSSTTCRWIGAEACPAHFTVSMSGTTASFAASSLAADFDLVWDFGDGTTSTEPTPVRNFTAGSQLVCLTISSMGGCTGRYCEFVSPQQQTSGECCDGNDRVVHKWTTYADGTRRFKSVLWQRNTFLYHRWGARTVNYARNASGNWTRAKAEITGAWAGGKLFGLDCKLSQNVSDSEENPNSAVAKVGTDAAIGAGPGPFRTKAKSLVSQHGVYHEGKWTKSESLYLSADCEHANCREGCRETAKTCKDVCTEAKETCRTECKDARKVCSNSCSGGWWKKLRCKVSCRWHAGGCRTDCRKGTPSCKRVCTEQKQVCKCTCR